MSRDTAAEAERRLRPDPAALGAAWATLVAADKEQVERLREWRSDDHYEPIARQFMADPRRQDDPILDALRAYSRPGATWLDVGAGAGRYALPLALASDRVIAVEPSQAMRAALSEAASDAGIENVELRPAGWPPAEDLSAYAADFGLMSHVGYDVSEINPFLDALEACSRERCLALMMDRVPNSGYERLWRAVHGEPRVRLPAARELIALLLARGALPEIRLFPREQGDLLPEEVRAGARRRLWLEEGSAKDRRLQRLLDQALNAGATDFQLPAVIALIVWTPPRERPNTDGEGG